MKTISQMENQNQIVITSSSEDEKQSLPFNVVAWLTLGVLAGLTVIFGLFLGANYLLSI